MHNLTAYGSRKLSVACCSLMIIQDLSGVHSTGMYNSRCTKFPMAVLAMYRMVK